MHLNQLRALKSFNCRPSSTLSLSFISHAFWNADACRCDIMETEGNVTLKYLSSPLFYLNFVLSKWPQVEELKVLLKKQQKVWEEGNGGGLTKPVLFPTHISMAETWSPGVISDKVSLLSLPSSSFTGGMAWRTLFMRGGSVGREDHEFLSLQSEGAQDPRFPFGLPLHSFPANLSQAFSTAWGCCGQSAGPST